MSFPSMPNPDVVIIGAGIIGINCALALQARGKRVLMLDRSGIAVETSSGNAGAFAFPEVEPLATPGIMLKAPKWLLDPLGPLSIPPAYAPKIAPWMLRFWRASWRDRYDASVTAQAALMTHSRKALDRVIADVGGEAFIRREGQLQLFQSSRAFAATERARTRRVELGIPFDVLGSPDAIAEIQPGLSPRFTHAIFTPTWMNVTDPALWARHLAAKVLERGGAFEKVTVTGLRRDGTGTTVLTERGAIRAPHVVVAAGAWSHKLAHDLGDRIPLETERGYNTTFSTASVDIKTHLTFSEHGFVVSRVGDGLRVGGAVELGGLDRPPNYARAQTLLNKAAEFLPGLEKTGGTQWMGYRPSLPDSLPVIGHASHAPDVIYAFGHGHLGLTQSSGTGDLVAALIDQSGPQFDLKPFRANRF